MEIRKATLEQMLGERLGVEEIGRRLGRHPSTVYYWMAKHGFVPPHRERHAGRGALQCSDLEELVAEGMSIAQIAEAVGRSKTTVRYWLKRFGVKTEVAANPLDSRRYTAGEPIEVSRVCRRHGPTDFVRSDNTYRCKRCRVESVLRRRRKVKELLVQEAGGRCVICGYDRHVGALEFHHVDRREKRHAIGSGASLSLAALRAEAAKCVLLCSNCHAEVETGGVALPATVPLT